MKSDLETEGKLRNDLIKTVCYFCDAVVDNKLSVAGEQLDRLNACFTRLKIKRHEEHLTNRLTEWQIYLHSILNDRQIEQLLFAIQEERYILIDGPQIPTGKTTFCRILRKMGLPAFENFESWGIQKDWSQALHLTLAIPLLPEQQKEGIFAWDGLDTTFSHWYWNWHCRRIVLQASRRE
ncbi:MAG: hypothetical protein ABF683_05620 [Sporolactobacillus sp.]